jgi:RNA polymerase-binding protein DksA
MSTVTDTERFRQLLVEERGRVQAALEHLQSESRGSLEAESDEIPSDNHLADTAMDTVDREIDDSLEGNAEDILSAIDAALERIEDGTYGTCLRCGKPISEDRLEALPWATLDIDCKRLEERG